MSDASEVMNGIKRRPGVIYPVLTPNIKGYEAAKQNNCDIVALFSAASETFSKKNTNCTISESLVRCNEIAERAKADGKQMRG